MLRSMFSAISALRNHQTYMDVIGNNIANVNTTGFKTGRVSFEDVLNQTLRGGNAPTGLRGGTNPVQVGLGMTVAAIDVIHAQGDLRPTGKLTDVAIQGDGFFIVNDGARDLYTRDGAFDVDANGQMVHPASGNRVQGWMPVLDVNGIPVRDANGDVTFDIARPVEDVVIDLNSAAPAKATQNVTLTGNLTAQPNPDPVVTTATVYDSLGRAHNIGITFTKAAAPAVNQWDIAAAPADANDPVIAAVQVAPVNIAFNNDGTIATVPAQLALTITPQANADAGFGAVQNDVFTNQVAVDIVGVTQIASNSEVNMTTQDGITSGTLISFDINKNGDIRGIYTNGRNQLLAKMAVAEFNNPGGLVRLGTNAFSLGPNSGIPQIGEPNTGGRGSLEAGSLESSNVNLAQQFTEMIIAERGFQANSRIITTSDEILQDLISLKR